MGLNNTIANRGDLDDEAINQGADGTAHITYFDVRTQASFVWDGIGEQITVAIGGYGEPVDHLINDNRLRFAETYAQLILTDFARLCAKHAATLPDYRSR